MGFISAPQIGNTCSCAALAVPCRGSLACIALGGVANVGRDVGLGKGRLVHRSGTAASRALRAPPDKSSGIGVGLLSGRLGRHCKAQRSLMTPLSLDGL